MRGARKVLVKLGQTEDFNLANLQQLRGYLLNGLNQNMTGLGTLNLPDNLVIRAIKVGADLSGVVPSRNGAYSPFAPEQYAVTENRQPGYDRNAIEEWRLMGVLASTMKDGNYVLPSTHGMAPGTAGVTIPPDEMFKKDGAGRYVNQKYIKNYLYWLGELQKERGVGE